MAKVKQENEEFNEMHEFDQIFEQFEGKNNSDDD